MSRRMHTSYLLELRNAYGVNDIEDINMIQDIS